MAASEREAPVTTHPPTDCRECRAGRRQAEQMAVAWYCSEHGRVEYDPAARIRALENALATARQLLATAHEHLASLDDRVTADLARGGMGVNILAEQRAAVRTVLGRIERAAGIPTGQEAP
jgi:hypothetical protein